MGTLTQMSVDARASAPGSRWAEAAARPGAHVVQVYDGDTDLALMVGSHLANGLGAGDRAVVIATPEHRGLFEAELAAQGVDVEAARADGRVIALDAAQTLARFMVDGSPDPDRFDEVIGGLVRELTAGGERLRAYGEMVAVLWHEGNVNGAIALEALWNELGAREPFALYCAYPVRAFAGAGELGRFDAVCAHHSHVAAPSEGDVAIAGDSSWRMFTPTADAARAARWFAVAALEQLGCPIDGNRASLIVSELASNAVHHARTSFSVTVSWRGGVARVEVHDLNPRAPRLLDVPPESTSGRGIHLVARTSDRYGWDLAGDGKVVWAELDEA